MSLPRLDRFNAFALLLAIGLHAAALGALLRLQAQPPARSEPLPLMASLILPAVPEAQRPPQPLPQRPRPQPAAKPPPTRLSVPAETPATATVPAPETLPPVLPPPEPSPAPVATPPAAPVAVAVAPSPPPVSPPRFDADYLDNPAPAYPPLSRRLGEEGRVVLRVYVHADGSAGAVEVRETSGFERLDRAAREAVARWRFLPARQGERPVAAWVLVPISFSLRS